VAPLAALPARPALFSLVVLAALCALFAAPAAASEALARQRSCLNCHAMERKLVGPAFVQVAERYVGRKEAPAYLAEKIIKGGAGAWGPVAMAANPQVSRDEALALANWVLALKAAPKK